MKRFWVIAVLVIMSFGAMVVADDIIIGPEDDPYIVSDSADSQAVPAPGLVKSPGFQFTPGINSISISQLDCGMFPYICTYVDALDSAGNPIGDLIPDSFCVYQDGVPVSGFTVEELTLDSCISSICLVIDLSGSMNTNNKIGAARNAAHAFVNNMDVYDRVAIVTFADCYNVLQNFTSDKTLLHSKINMLSANGATAAFDGIWKGLDITTSELGSRAVIAITDGMENYSQYCGGSGTPDGLWKGYPGWSGTDPFSDDSTLICNLATGAGIPLYTISLGTEFDPQYLMHLSAGTGGDYYHAPTGDDIDDIYDEIKYRLCSRYLICFNSADTVQNGDWHSYTVCRRNDDGSCSGLCDSSSCQEVASPTIVQTPPTVGLDSTCQRWGTATEICAYITDLDTPQEDLTVQLFYRNSPSVGYTSVPMVRTDSTYCYTIPGSVLTCSTDSIQYYITASDGQVTVASPALAPTSHHAFAVCENHAPTVDAGADQTIAQCSVAQICWSTSAEDIDGNLEIVEKITGPGTFDGSQICFTPTGTLNYEFVLRATDSCGLTAFDTVVINYSLNVAPVANAGADQSLFQCSPTEICWPASCTDANGNLTNCELISGVGSYNGSQICFTPNASGTYEFILKATDACGAVDYDTALVAVELNSAPVCTVPNDTTIFQCAPTQVNLPYSATDVDGNFQSCQIISGPGSLVGGNWRYTPSYDQTVTVTLRCQDSCGVYCQSTFVVAFDINQAPVIALGADTAIFLCAAGDICLPYTVSDGDIGQATTVTLLSAFGTLNSSTSTICFTPDTMGVYTFIAQIEDACGATDVDTIRATIDFNDAPVANAGVDNSYFLCAPQQICWSASCSDVNGNLTNCELISGVGSYNGSQICFTPSVSGNFEFILKATDACGAEDYDTATIAVTLNTAPVVVAQADTSLFLCSPQEVCVSYTSTDVDPVDAVLTETMLSGYGSLDAANDRICFTPTAAGTYEFIIGATDGCGAGDADTIEVVVSFGQFASITCPSSAYNKFLCGPDSVIQTLAISPAGATVSVSEGIYANGAIRFYAATAGTYNIEVIADASCGSDTCTVVFNVTMNSAPVANAGVDNSYFLCAPQQICWSASCSDVNGNLTNCELISGVGSYNGSQICFTPSVSGNFEFILKATDACGAEDYDTATIAVTLNTAPVVVAQADTSLFLCSPQEVCVSYTSTDVDPVDAVLTETMLSGYGSLDAANDRICFTPTAAGTYEFIIGATDGCGAGDADTIEVVVSFGQFASIDCPVDPISVSLCDTVEICRILDITPAAATVSVSLGTYANGEHCFTPDSSGTYIVTVIAEASCGADTCQLVYNVDIGQTAEIVCPGTQTIFRCQPGQVCVPISVVTPEADFTITPIGTYNSGAVCFQADTSGHYEINIIAATDCGADTCDIIADITINTSPVAVDPATPVDTFLCTAGQICYQFDASDIDNESLTWTKLAGNGSITSSGNWCFNAATDGSYSISAAVSDGCGAADTVILAYNVDINSAPTVTMPNDTSIFICEGNQYCFDYTAADGDDNIMLEELTSGSGTIDTAANTVCFTPTAAGVYAFAVKATDACGGMSEQTVEITVAFGVPLTIDCPNDTAIFQCLPQEICRPITISNDSLVTVSPVGYYDNGQVCFTPDTAGHYVFFIEAASVCGSADCSFAVDVSLNSPPVAVDPPSPVDTFICAIGQICYQFEASDVDGGALTWTRISGNGTVSSSGLWCMNATNSETKTVLAAVTDPCGAADTITMSVNVAVNAAPIVSLPAETDVFLCPGQSVCFDYTVSDFEDNVVLVELVSSEGTIDTAAGQICLMPTMGDYYAMIVRATDACGAADEDTIGVSVMLGAPMTIDCPSDTTVFLCGPAQICRPVTIPIDTSVSVSPIGTYANGEVCFDADTAGVYDITVLAVSDCGSADCTFRVTVGVNDNPVAEDPTSPVDTFMCAAGEICYQFVATDDGGNLTWSRLSGSGTVSATGLWCFTAGASGSYMVTARVVDSCGAADTVSLQYNVTINTDPALTLPNDTTIFMCGPEEFCFSYIVNDPNDNIAEEAIIEGAGTIDTATNNVCFTPTMAGSWRFILGVRDVCGSFKANGYDTLYIEVVFNEAPVADAGDDFSTFLCGTADVCFPVSCTDVNNDLDTCFVASGGGILSGGQVCFTPAGAGSYPIVIAAVDECGLSDYDTVVVTVAINSDPICDLPNDTTIFQCGPTAIGLPLGVTDPNGNFDHWELVSGPGAIVGNEWTHTPAGSEIDTIVIRAYDACGSFCEGSFVPAFEMNHKPVADAGGDASYTFCSPGETICWPAGCSDIDDNLTACALVSPYGTYNEGAGEICFPIASGIERSYAFIMQATDACGLISADTSWISVSFNTPPVVDLPNDLQVPVPGIEEVCFDADIFDTDGNLANYTISPLGNYNEASGKICFDADTTGEYLIVVTATDSCGAEATDSVRVTVQIDECLFVQIEKAEGVLQGHYHSVDVLLNGSGKDLGGFDMLIAYDRSVLIAAGAEAGDLFDNCHWEYFTYRFGENGNCESCPSGMLRLIGLAETNNGAYHPICGWQGQSGSIARIDFFVPNNYTVGGQYAPVEFYWFDCADNSFSSVLGDTLWVSRVVYNFEWQNITDYTYGFPGGYGVPDSCLDGGGPGKPRPERCVDFTNGGIDIIHPDDIDDRGDINLNGVSNEIADAVMFTNFFITGLSAFGDHVEGSIAASDVNADGTSLTVADLVYLVRIIIGDATPYAKPQPGNSVTVRSFNEGEEVSVDYTSSSDIGAMLLVFGIEGEAGQPDLGISAADMSIAYNNDGSQLRVLIYNIGTNAVPAGSGRLLTVPVSGNIELLEVEAADYFGRPLNSTSQNIPRIFELGQNYPNPFNPTTTIKFTLPEPAVWKLTVYNILGQVVDTWSGKNEAGLYEVVWNGSKYASGIYLYQLNAGTHVQAKKMILLK